MKPDKLDEKKSRKPNVEIEFSVEVVDDGKPEKGAAFWRVVKTVAWLSFVVCLIGCIFDIVWLFVVGTVAFAPSFLLLVARAGWNFTGFGSYRRYF